MLITYVDKNGKQAAFNSDLFVLAESQDDGTTILTLMCHLPERCECGRILPAKFQKDGTYQVVAATPFIAITTQMEQATGVFA
jgi:hypothetical protein